MIYEKKGMLDLATDEYGKAIAKGKNWYLPQLNIGNVYNRKGDYTGAERAYRRALAAAPENADVLNNLAFLLYRQGRRTEAKALIERIADIGAKEEYKDTYRQIMEKNWPSN